ncbi:MAG: hypothetical protein KDJ41_01330 [Hyphomicrobiaceae bacterium]|nr:hypothetical protein [Hyphomicrobiaceae bacterium]
MLPKHRPALIAATLLASLALGGCAGNSPGLTTASIFGGNTVPPAAATPAPGPAAAQPAAVPTPDDPMSRSVQVATTSALATRCGFYFDPAKLKTTFLTAESQRGTPPDTLQKVDRAYDVTHARISKAAAGNETVCKGEKKLGEIRTDLGRHLAGDYTPRPRTVAKKKDDGGFFADFMTPDASGSKPRTRNDILALPEYL